MNKFVHKWRFQSQRLLVPSRLTQALTKIKRQASPWGGRWTPRRRCPAVSVCFWSKWPRDRCRASRGASLGSRRPCSSRTPGSPCRRQNTSETNIVKHYFIRGNHRKSSNDTSLLIEIDIRLSVPSWRNKHIRNNNEDTWSLNLMEVDDGGRWNIVTQRGYLVSIHK